MRFSHATRTTTALALAIAAGWAAAGPARGDVTPATAASAADVRQLLDAGDYKGTVAAASRLTAPSSKAKLSDADRAAILAEKGEAHLQLKQNPQAIDAYAKAAKLDPNPDYAATDNANALLARRSHNGQYAPRPPAGGGAKPAAINILTGDGRREAFAALFADELAAAAPRFKAAESAQNIPQLIAAADLASSLRGLEVAATGTDAQTKPAVAAIANHAHGLLQNALTTLSTRATAIGEAANTYLPAEYNAPSNNGGFGGPYAPGAAGIPQKVGLTDRNKQELTDIVNTCGQIGPAADTFARLTADKDGGAAATPPTAAIPPTVPTPPTPAVPATPADPAAGGWDAVSAEAKRVAKQAEDVLTATYNQTAVGRTGGTRRPTR